MQTVVFHHFQFGSVWLQGYVDAADVFQKESNTKPGVDLAAITDRMEIRKAVQSGDIQQAIERVNDLNPEVSKQSCTTLLSYIHTFLTRVLGHHAARVVLKRADAPCLKLARRHSRSILCMCRFWSSSISCRFTYSSSG